MKGENLVQLMSSRSNYSEAHHRKIAPEKTGEKPDFQERLGRAIDSKEPKSFKDLKKPKKSLNSSDIKNKVNEKRSKPSEKCEDNAIQKNSEKDQVSGAEAASLAIGMLQAQKLQAVELPKGNEDTCNKEISGSDFEFAKEAVKELKEDISVEIDEGSRPVYAADKTIVKMPEHKMNSASLTKESISISDKAETGIEKSEFLVNKGVLSDQKTVGNEELPETTPLKSEYIKEDTFYDRVSVARNGMDSGKVNIKVADAPVDVYRNDANQQIVDRIMHKLSEGKHIFDIELNPKSLGKINIKLIFQNGGAELIMTTASSKAHQLMTMNAEALRGILESATGLNSSVQVKEGEGAENLMQQNDLSGQNQNKQQSENQKRREHDSSADFIERLRLGLTGGSDMAEAF